MAKIAIVASGLSGRLHSSLELANRLVNEGHTIRFICSESIGEKITIHGFQCITIPEINFQFVSDEYNKPSLKQKYVHHFKNIGKHYSKGKEILNLKVYKSILKEVNPDRVLADVELHDLIFTAIALNIPVTLYHTWFSDKISVKIPSIRTAIIPGKGFEGSQLGIAFSWLKMRVKIYGRVLLNHLTLKHYRRVVLKKYAKEIGFSASNLMVNTLPPLYSFTKLPLLSFTMSEMDFPHNPPKNLRYVGPMVYDKREIKTVNNEFQDVLNDKMVSDKKLIYCSGSSVVSGDITFMKKLIEAVASNKSWVLIITLGKKISKEQLGNLPNNVHVYGWVPQLKILEKTDLCITHAGVNSINECIHFAVPMLAYSGKNFDQNGNAARIAYHAIGISGDKDVDTTETIKNNISSILEDTSYKNKMIALQSTYNMYKDKALTPLL